MYRCAVSAFTVPNALLCCQMLGSRLGWGALHTQPWLMYTFQTLLTA